MRIQNLLSSLKELTKPVIKDKKQTLNGHEFVDKVLTTSATLANNGIKKDTPILLNMSNDVDSVITLLAAWNNEAVVFISNPFSPISKIRIRLMTLNYMPSLVVMY